MKDVGALLEECLKDPAFRRAWEELDLPYQVARALIGLRLRLGLSQEEFARRAGVSRSLVARLESGGRLPSLRLLDRMARRLGHRVKLELVPADEEAEAPRGPESARRGVLEALMASLAEQRRAKGVDEDEALAGFEEFRKARARRLGDL